MPSNEDLKGAEAKVVQPQQPEPTFWEFGDVHFECNRCGNYQLIDKGVPEGGMQFVLPVSDQHEWRLVCGKCQNMMRIFYKESDEETKVEGREKAKVEEENQRLKAEQDALDKANKELENESKEENQEEGLDEGSTEDTTGVHESDGEGEPTVAVTDKVGS